VRRLEPFLPGPASGPVLALGGPLSFWGGVDGDTAEIADRSHPDFGTSIAGGILWLPELRGSGGTPGAIASLIKLGLGPAAILMPKADANLLAGLIVAHRLYGTLVPYWKAATPPDAGFFKIDASGERRTMPTEGP
jgi:predicted aconitase with swiveling domain